MLIKNMFKNGWAVRGRMRPLWSVRRRILSYTPVRNILPGYSASLRQEIIEESMRIDSLQHTMDLQTQYISVIRDVVAGEVKSDTVVGLDSMQIVMQEKLLEAKNEATVAFMAEYKRPCPFTLASLTLSLP